MIKLIDILSEIGDASVKAFPWTRKDDLKKFLAKLKKNATDNYNKIEVFSYEITSPNAIYLFKLGCYIKKRQNFVLHFGDGPPPPKPKENFDLMVYIAFNTKGSKIEKETNLNEQYGLMSTIIECLTDFVKNIDEDIHIEEINYQPKADTGKDTDMGSKRAKLYLAFLKQNINKLPGKWTAFSSSDKIQIKQGDWTTTGDNIVAKN